METSEQSPHDFKCPAGEMSAARRTACLVVFQGGIEGVFGKIIVQIRVMQ